MRYRALIIFATTIAVIVATGVVADAAGTQIKIRSGACAVRLSDSSAAAMSGAGVRLTAIEPATMLPPAHGMGLSQPASGAVALDMQTGHVQCAGGWALTGRDARSIRFESESVDLATHTVRGTTTAGGQVTDLCTFQISPSTVSAAPTALGVRDAGCTLTPATARAIDDALGVRVASSPGPFALAGATFDLTQVGVGTS